MAEKKAKKPKRINVQVAPAVEKIEELSIALSSNGFLVCAPVGGDRKAYATKMLAEALWKNKALRGVVWFVPRTDSVELWAQPSPDEDAAIRERIRIRRRHPDDLFEDYKVAAALAAPLYGLAGVFASELGISSEWERDGALPMKLFVTQYVEVPPDEEPKNDEVSEK